MEAKVHIREAARLLGVNHGTVRRWIERLNLPVVVLPDGRAYLRRSDVRKIESARAGNERATKTSAGMRRWHHERGKSA